MMRLDKYLADMGIGTRQEVKRYIRQGRVSIDGNPAKSPETKVEEKACKITFDGREVDYADYEYYMLNKPSGVVSATEDARCATVIDLIRDKKRKLAGSTRTRRDCFLSRMTDSSPTGCCRPRSMWTRPIMPKWPGRLRRRTRKPFGRASI